MILTEKETMVLGGMMETAFENMGVTEASVLKYDNFSGSNMDSLKEKTQMSVQSIGGTLGNLIKKGVVNFEFDFFGKKLYFIDDKGVEFLVNSGC